MAEDASPPTVEEFAARHKPQKPQLDSIFDLQPGLWADVVRLRDEFRLTWQQISSYLAQHGVEAHPCTLRQLWHRRQTR